MFIDFENLVYGVENNNTPSDDQQIDVDIQRLVRFVRDEGRLVLARAYADWRSQSVRQHQQDLYVQGIETMHVFGRRYGSEIKNSVDVALAVDAVRALYERQFDTFVLISGDRDFLPLLRVVREHGHRIIGVSVRESASRDLPNLCDRFVYYRDLWRTWGPEEQRDRAQRSPGEIRDLAVFKEQMRQLLAEEVGPGGILGATLKPMIRNRIDPGFDEMQFGFLKFSKLLEAMPDVVRIEFDAHGRDIRVFAADGEQHSHGLGDPNSETVDEDGEVVQRPTAVLAPAPVRPWEPTPEAFSSRARARLARTGLHLEVQRRHEILEFIHAELPTGDDYRSQAQILEQLERRAAISGNNHGNNHADDELELTAVRRYLWALYQSWVFDINPPDRGLDHLARGLRLKSDYREVDHLCLRVEQSLVYKVYELLPQEPAEARARVCALLEIDDARAGELLERVEVYRRSQQHRGR
jgi:uncharacterized protein (TIGR00288 family)